MDQTILLVGNGSHLNRGCEAIFQGTRRILRDVFGENLYLNNGLFASTKEITQTQTKESDPLCSHFGLAVAEKPLTRVLRKLSQVSALPLPGAYPGLNPHQAIAALEVGGDNYSLDYGIPKRYIDLDNYMMRKGLPTFIWGASVGPFDKKPQHKSAILDHLRKITTIYARERHTIEYLRNNAVENVQLMADPAFLMLPQAPDAGIMNTIPKDAIALNLSPLMARYVCNGDYAAWQALAVRLAQTVLEHYSEDLILLPHVTDAQQNPKRDDYLLLEHVYHELAANYSKRLHLLPPTLNAPQLKHIISCSRYFIGSRTHATIAAFSTNVPTISLAYSIKANGLNEDIYGTLDYCIAPETLTPESLEATLTLADANREQMIEKSKAYNGQAYELIKNAATHLKSQLER